MSTNDADDSIGRRRFIKSLFLGSLAESQPAKAQDKPIHNQVRWFWCDLQNGFVGFPTGLYVPHAFPGSIMKLVAAAALADLSLINPNERYDCHGHIQSRGETINCQFAHGHIDLTRAIAVSCNCYFVNASLHLSPDAFLTYARKLGLDQTVAGSHGVFSQNLKGPPHRYVLGLDENLQPSSLQLLLLAATIATKGNVPYLHSAEEHNQGQSFTVHLHEATWRHLQQGMRMACKDGTAKHLDPENKLYTAAKTGTAMRGKQFYSSVIGFFPFNQPRHAFCVSAPSGTSQESAVPRAHEFLFSTTWPQ